MANLTFVSSACDMVSTAYASTKESHPYIRSVCDAAEKGVKSMTEATASCVQPLLTTLEPQGNSLGKRRSATPSEGLSLLPALKGALGCGNVPLLLHGKRTTPDFIYNVKKLSLTLGNVIEGCSPWKMSIEFGCSKADLARSKVLYISCS